MAASTRARMPRDTYASTPLLDLDRNGEGTP